jgi:transcriptional regulator with XRE-family HTH domain
MNSIDRHVGSRLRLRRMELRLSRRELATVLRVTVDRIRRFEAGEERIGASRLCLVAETLGVPVQYFFANAMPDSDDGGEPEELEPEPFLAHPLSR